MPDEPDVLGPGERLRIARARQDEAPAGPAARRLDEQGVQRRLAVGGPGADEGQIRGEGRVRLGRAVNLGVDVAVERRGPPRAQPLAQEPQRLAPRVGQDEVEIGQALGRQVVGPLPAWTRASVTPVSMS